MRLHAVDIRTSPLLLRILARRSGVAQSSVTYTGAIGTRPDSPNGWEATPDGKIYEYVTTYFDRVPRGTQRIDRTDMVGYMRSRTRPGVMTSALYIHRYGSIDVSPMTAVGAAAAQAHGCMFDWRSCLQHRRHDPKWRLPA